MATIGELNQIINLIKNENKTEGNTKERIAKAIETLRDLDVWVKKQQGKGLSTNDFTDELKQKIQDLDNTFTQKGGYEGTAKDLKTAIDNINRILQSDDTDLDQLQEIVNYIKQNKQILDTLAISNIAGLQDALNDKADTTHTHSFSDLSGTENIATKQEITDAIEAIKIGGRNLIKGGFSQGFWKQATVGYHNDEPRNGRTTEVLNLDQGETYSFSMKKGAVMSAGGVWFTFYNQDDSYHSVMVKHAVPFTFVAPAPKCAITFDASYYTSHHGDEVFRDLLPKLENGNKITDWSLAPEDVQAQIRATEQKINNLQVGGRNLLRNSKYLKKGDEGGGIAYVGAITGMIAGQTYIATAKKINGRTNEEDFYLNQRTDWWNGTPQLITIGVPFVASHNHKHFWVRCPIGGMQAEYQFIMLERGNKPADWSPAPEDIDVQINTTILKTSANVSTSQAIDGFSQNGRTLVTQGTANLVVTVDSADGFASCYQKGGTGSITFQAASGKTLVQVDGTNVINGAKGSTATVTVIGNEVLLRISNV